MSEPGQYEDQWMGPRAVVKYVGLPSIKAFYQSVQRGEIPAYKWRKRGLRCKKSELDALFSPRPVGRRDNARDNRSKRGGRSLRRAG